MVIRNRIHPGQFIGSFYVPERGLVVLPSHRERHSFQCTDAVLFSLLRQPCLDDGNEERQPEHRIIPRPPSRLMNHESCVEQSDQRFVSCSTSTNGNTCSRPATGSIQNKPESSVAYPRCVLLLVLQERNLCIYMYIYKHKPIPSCHHHHYHTFGIFPRRIGMMILQLRLQ